MTKKSSVVKLLPTAWEVYKRGGACPRGGEIPPTHEDGLLGK